MAPPTAPKVPTLAHKLQAEIRNLWMMVSVLGLTCLATITSQMITYRTTKPTGLVYIHQSAEEPSQAEAAVLRAQTVRVESNVGYGSGTIVGEDDVSLYILGAWHVTKGPAIEIFVRNDDGSALQAMIWDSGASPNSGDWTILRTLGKFEHYRLAQTYRLGRPSLRSLVGLPALTAGHSDGQPYTVLNRYGEIQAIDPQGSAEGLLISNAPITFGNSGGGLYVRVGGELLLCGVTVMVALDKKDCAISWLNYSVPLHFVRFTWED